MDKTGQAIYVRFPIGLEAKIRARARKAGRTLSQQIVFDCSLSEHVQDHDIEKDTLNFFDSEGKNCQKD